MTSEGLETIDAAVVESSGPSYEPAPSVEVREEVAHRVLSTLGVDESSIDLDTENSERYHLFFPPLGLDRSAPSNHRISPPGSPG